MACHVTQHGSVVKKIYLPMQETWVCSLGCEDPLEKEMAIHSSIIAWNIPSTEEPGGLQSMGSQNRWTWLGNWTISSLLPIHKSSPIYYNFLLSKADKALNFHLSAIPLSIILCLVLCLLHVSKTGKLSSSHRTGKGQFSFQSQRKVTPMNVQTTVQLCSFHMLAK